MNWNNVSRETLKRPTYNIGKITSAFHREASLFCGGVWDSAGMFHVKHFGSFSKCYIIYVNSMAGKAGLAFRVVSIL